MRVLLTQLPPLLRDILSEALAGESDFAIVSGSPHVVIVQARREEGERVAHEYSDATTVVIDPKGESALVFRSAEEPVVLADVSPTTLIMAIRGGG